MIHIHNDMIHCYCTAYIVPIIKSTIEDIYAPHEEKGKELWETMTALCEANGGETFDFDTDSLVCLHYASDMLESGDLTKRFDVFTTDYAGYWGVLPTSYIPFKLIKGCKENECMKIKYPITITPYGAGDKKSVILDIDLWTCQQDRKCPFKGYGRFEEVLARL